MRNDVTRVLHKRAQELQDTLDDTKRQKVEVGEYLKHMGEKWNEEKERANKYFFILEKQK